MCANLSLLQKFRCAGNLGNAGGEGVKGMGILLYRETRLLGEL